MNPIDFKHNLFSISILLIHISYLAVFFGILYIDQRYIRIFSTFIQFCVCIFLMIRFFPLRKIHNLTKLDISIIFYCATFLFMNVVLVEIYNMLPHTMFSDKIYKMVETK
jgi:hypothetical protein